MKIGNSMQFNSRTSFGMALKITPAAKDSLQKTTMDTIQKLAKAGEELKDTKFYHLEIGENLAPRIDSIYANSHKAPFRPVKPNDEFLVIETKWDGTELNGLKKGSNYSVVVKFSSKEEAIKEYDKLHNMNTDLDRAVEVTKVFEKRELQKEAEKTDADKLREAVKKAAADLIAKFGAESHIK